MLLWVNPNTYKSLLIMILVAFLAGCGSENPVKPAEISPTTATRTPSPSSTLTLTPQPTETPIPSDTPSPEPTATTDAPPTAQYNSEGQVFLGKELIFDMAEENAGCFGIGALTYAPGGDHFLVIVQCYEDDNEMYLFPADGSWQTRVTGPWDYLNYHNYEWAPDGLSFLYYRINSCCIPLEDLPPEAPPTGVVRYELASGTKTLLSTPTPAVIYYRVIHVDPGDVLNVRAAPDPYSSIVGTIPYDGVNVRITGEGVPVGYAHWFPITYEGVTGWVNETFLVIQMQP